MTLVDLIIPTHNGIDLLHSCLRSLQRSDFTDFNLIVFDDASTVPVDRQVHSLWPTACILRSETNVGLVTAFNAAIGASSSPYLVLLNDDTEVEPAWLGTLVARAESDQHAGSVASKMRLFSNRRMLHSAGDLYSVRGMPGNRGAWLLDYGQYDDLAGTFSACGGAALYRRAALEAVRLQNGDIFDSRLFMYCEDVDLGWRLHVAGWSCAFEPLAVVYHHLSATGGGPLASYYVARNVWLVLARSIPRGVMSPYRSRIAAYHAGRLLNSLRHAREPAARATLRGTFAGMFLALTSRQPRAVSLEETRRLRALLHSPTPTNRGV